jgi:hypothetical protein
MSHRSWPLAVWLVIFVSGPLVGCQADKSQPAEVHQMYLPNWISWQEAPNSLPPGAQMAILDGDPSKEGPFCMRLKFPDGYRVMPHWHPKTERVTVISGTLNLGFGDTFDSSKTHPLPAGTYGYWTPGTHHFAYAQGETILQLNSIGPWKINYVNPADDPRKNK